MKKIILAVYMNLVLVFPTCVYSGGIPVIDGANLAQAIEQVLMMIEQMAVLKDQLATADEMLASVSGVRDMVDAVATIYGEELNIDTDEILTELGVAKSGELGLSGPVADLYDESLEAEAQLYGKSSESFLQTTERFVELVKLVDKINDSPDQKDILDLQARIEAEDVLLQNELNNLTIQKQEAEMKIALIEKKKIEVLLRSGGEVRELETVWATPF